MPSMPRIIGIRALWTGIKMKKGAIELSLNFIIIMIISIAVFAFGVYFLKQIMSHAENTVLVWDKRTESMIEDMLDNGGKIAIPFNSKTAPRGEMTTYGIGILNMLDENIENNFALLFRYNKYVNNDDPDQGLPAEFDPNTWPAFSEQALPFENGNGWKKLIKPIQNNKQEKFLMGVKVPKDAPSGTYIYDLNITYMDGAAYIAYDNHIWKIYVNVP